MSKALSETPKRIERPIDAKRRAVFLSELARHGVVNAAAAAASLHAEGHAAGGFYALRRRDPAFAEQWDAAQAQADANLLLEARRRAVEGDTKGLYFKGQRVYDTDPETGERVPVSERVYSDRLMELLLKARFPSEFIERRAVEHSTKPNGWAITSADLAALSESQVEQLSAIMETVMEARGEMESGRAVEYADAVDADFEEVPSEEKEVEYIPW